MTFTDEPAGNGNVCEKRAKNPELILSSLGSALFPSSQAFPGLVLASAPPSSSTWEAIDAQRFQENFAVDPYCGGGINSGGQWPIPNCGGPMCHHGPGPGLPPGSGPGPGPGPGPGQGPGPGPGSGMGTLVHGPSQLSLHGPPLPPPPLWWNGAERQTAGKQSIGSYGRVCKR
uniref:Uncharacterized protein n=1 Tax=Anopheles atroparvus TaxID=41427 RepID=A0A182JHR6_ANOAO